MAHQRIMNILLFVIATCLVVLTTKQLGIEIIPQVQAQPGTPGSQVATVRIVGCHVSLSGGPCVDWPIRVTESGALYVAK